MRLFTLKVLTESLKNVSEAERQGAFTHMKGVENEVQAFMRGHLNMISRTLFGLTLPDGYTGPSPMSSRFGEVRRFVLVDKIHLLGLNNGDVIMHDSATTFNHSAFMRVLKAVEAGFDK